jgi:hypothetical protein
VEPDAAEPEHDVTRPVGQQGGDDPGTRAVPHFSAGDIARDPSACAATPSPQPGAHAPPPPRPPGAARTGDREGPLLRRPHLAAYGSTKPPSCGVGEFRKTRHPRNVKFDKILETCFSGAGNSRFSEARNL